MLPGYQGGRKSTREQNTVKHNETFWSDGYFVPNSSNGFMPVHLGQNSSKYIIHPMNVGNYLYINNTTVKLLCLKKKN